MPSKGTGGLYVFISLLTVLSVLAVRQKHREREARKKEFYI